MVIFVVTLFAAAAFSLVLTPIVAGLGARAGLLDHPGGRKIHAAPTPRVGGGSIALSCGLALLLAHGLAPYLRAAPVSDLSALWPILAGALLVFVVGVWDDIWDLAPHQKLLAQIAAAGMVVASGLVIDRITVLGAVYDFGWGSVPVTVFWIVAITNAFNLVDGVDGLAGGLVCIAASTCAVILLVRGNHPEALLLVAFLGAVIGFLPYNLNPAEVFLGDSGSLLSGFLLGVTAIAGHQKGATALAVGVPLLIFALPLADTAFSIVRRLIRGQRTNGGSLRTRVRGLSAIFRADQGHIHHRLIARGLSHRRTVLLLYALAALCSAVALITMQLP